MRAAVARCTLAALLLSASACSPSAPVERTAFSAHFALVAVRGQPLPAAQFDTFVVSAGGLTFRSDGRVVRRISRRGSPLETDTAEYRRAGSIVTIIGPHRRHDSSQAVLYGDTL